MEYSDINIVLVFLLVFYTVLVSYFKKIYYILQNGLQELYRNPDAGCNKQQ